MASSFTTFRYPITRVYPYKWYPWVVYAGGLCLIVFFSVFNFAANGYILTVQYTSDYNGAMATKTWAQKFALIGKVVSSCQSQNLPVHSQLYTDKLSLVYGLQNIWVEGEQGRIQTLPSLQYANNPLQNCTVPLIYLDFESTDRTAAQIGWGEWGINAKGVVTCSIDNGAKKTWMNLTVEYNFITPDIENGAATQFVQRPEEKTQSALWWGESLLSWYWLNLRRSLTDNTSEPSSDVRILKGSLVLSSAGNVTDITSLDFFVPFKYHFTTADIIEIDSESKRSIVGPSKCCIHPGNNPRSLRGLDKAKVWPNSWLDADAFTKVFYSVILADLGQKHALSNLLTNPSVLATFSEIVDKHELESMDLQAGPARTRFKETDGYNLSITDSYFFTEYLCQTPTRKSAGSLVLSVLVANLVFLNAAWVLLNWFAVKKLEGTKPTAHYCDGCAGSTAELVDIGSESPIKNRYRAQTHVYEHVNERDCSS